MFSLQQKNLFNAFIASVPLSLSVVPWGILCGTLGIQAGLSPFQSQLMSLAVFAGSAQLAGLAIFMAGAGWLSLINTTIMVNVRHLLYSATYKEYILPMPFYKRFCFAFLLTDEMFALTEENTKRTGAFDYTYAMTVGLTFYIFWNIATFIGIYAANYFKNIDSLGFDFAIAATFIAMLIPMLKQKIMIIVTVITAVLCLILEMIHFKNALLISAIVGMFVGSMLTDKQGYIND
ncbi:MULTISPECIES: AzlC family ABC transporter permease [unclassified Acinetobacter]|uniref:AzlC family ABC transporter permease n=1 Tax=unclassified Acinetobacter TaxID=196816 RepID=UPI0035B6D886